MLMFANSYARLPGHFYARLDPTPVAEPRLIQFNAPLAAELGLDASLLDSPTLAAVFSGSRVPEGAEPLAMVYAGHQFGQFVPQLGDGRAILLGEVRDVRGVLRDVQLKGSGVTPFSRNGDGRAALGPVLREYLVSEAMYALGIAATRSLAAVASGEAVYRERALPGAVLTRVALSHVRVGTFQYFAARGDTEALRRLAAYVIERLYPQAATRANPPLALLEAVVERQARLVAAWMQVGFIHGVMNTDNMALSGETIDFGPCAFLDDYDPGKVFSSIDGHGRYAYSNQPLAAQWNLARLAETLLPLIDADQERAVEAASAAINAFAPQYAEHWLQAFRAKLGFATRQPQDAELVEALLDAMHANQADFTLVFRRLCAAAESAAADAAVAALFARPHEFDAWALRWRARLALEPQPATERAAAMRRANPAYIPRNHQIERVILAAAERADFAPFAELHRVLARPFDERPEFAAYAEPPLPAERVTHTFCGT